MPLRFRRTVKLAPGLHLNFALHGMSVSLGGRGGSLNIGRRGVYSNVGIPGTGLSYREPVTGGKRTHRVAPPQHLVGTTMDITLRVGDDGVFQFLDRAGSPLPPRLVKIARDQLGTKINEILQHECEKRNLQIEAVLKIHRETPPPGHYREFTRTPFVQPSPPPPVERTPSFFTRLFKRRRAAFLQAVALERSRWEADLHEWQKARDEHEQRERAAADRFALAQAGDADAMAHELDELLRGIEWPRETSVSFQFSDDATGLLLDVDLPELEEMPEEEVTVAGRGLKLNVKHRSEPQRRREYLAHVHGVVFRIVGETFRLFEGNGPVGCGLCEADHFLMSCLPRPTWTCCRSE
jgi:hypothetical protein